MSRSSSSKEDTKALDDASYIRRYFYFINRGARIVGLSRQYEVADEKAVPTRSKSEARIASQLKWARTDKRIYRLPTNNWIRAVLICGHHENESSFVNSIYLKNLCPHTFYYKIVGQGVKPQTGVLKEYAREILHVVSDHDENVLALLSTIEGFKWWKPYLYTNCNAIMATNSFIDRFHNPLDVLPYCPLENRQLRHMAKRRGREVFAREKTEKIPTPQDGENLCLRFIQRFY